MTLKKTTQNLKELINHADQFGKQQGMEAAIKYFDKIKIVFMAVIMVMMVYYLWVDFKISVVLLAFLWIHLFLNHVLWQVRTTQDFLETKFAGVNYKVHEIISFDKEEEK
jgi:hypothetical protein